MDVTAMSMVLLWILVIGNILLTFAILRRLAFLNQPGAAGSLPLTPPGRGPEVTTLAPDFRVTTDEKNIHISELVAASPLVLGFFASDCASCVSHAAPFNKFAEQQAARQPAIRCLALIDGVPEDSQHLAGQFTDDAPVVFAPRHRSSTFSEYNIMTYPTFVRVGKGGRVEHVTSDIADMPVPESHPHIRA